MPADFPPIFRLSAQTNTNLLLIDTSRFGSIHQKRNIFPYFIILFRFARVTSRIGASIANIATRENLLFYGNHQIFSSLMCLRLVHSFTSL